MRLAAFGLLFALLSGSVQAYIFELPLLYEEREAGLVMVEVEGDRLLASDGPGLAEAMAPHLDQAVVLTLQSYGMIAMEELTELGIEIAYRPRTMELVARLTTDIFATSAIDFAQQPRVHTNVVQASKGALLNNFNLAAERRIESDQVRATFDWLGSANVGGIRGINLIWAATAEYRSEEENLDIHRGAVTAFHDIPSWPLRISAGDVSSPFFSHLGGGNLGGVAISSSYYELQPSRRLSPGSRQQLIVRERADVEIYMNGRALQRLRLAPGRYDLNDLPLAPGSNDIEIFLYYASGEHEVQRFSQFYNAHLLHPGITNLGFASGYRSEFSPYDGTQYSDDIVSSGFIEQGVFSWLTVGAHGQHSDFGHVYGVNTAFGTPLGNFSIRYSQSETPDITGEARSIEWQYTLWGSRSGAPNLLLAHDQFIDFNNRPWLHDAVLDGTRTLARYSAFITNNIELRLTYQRDLTRSRFERREDEVRLMYRWRALRIGGGARRGNLTSRDVDEFEAFLTVDFNFFRPASSTRIQGRYDSYNEQAQVSVGRVPRLAVGDFSYNLSHIEAPQNSSTYLRSDYVANRGRLGTFGQYRHSQESAAGYVGAQANTAVGWAGGRFGWGRAGAGSFTIVSTHRSLKGVPVLVNDGRHGPEAISRSYAGALLTARQRYRDAGLLVDVPDAPIGYDWGGGHHYIEAGAVTGTSLTVGSDAFYSALGVLVDAEGEGISLEAGRLTGENITMTIFTNRGGRFIAEGLRPGNYEITLLPRPDIKYHLHIPEGNETFLRVGTLFPVKN